MPRRATSSKNSNECPVCFNEMNFKNRRQSCDTCSASICNMCACKLVCVCSDCVVMSVKCPLCRNSYRLRTNRLLVPEHKFLEDQLVAQVARLKKQLYNEDRRALHNLGHLADTQSEDEDSTTDEEYVPEEGEIEEGEEARDDTPRPRRGTRRLPQQLHLTLSLAPGASSSVSSPPQAP